MGFFKKIFKPKTEEKLPPEPRSVSLIEKQISEKQISINNSLNSIYEKMYNQILVVLDNLDEKIETLEQKDLDETKQKENFKHASETGRTEYLGKVLKLKENLREKKQADKGIFFINQQLRNFEKSSRKSYERMTILIGKEAKEVKNEIDKIRKIEKESFDEVSQLLQTRESIKNLSQKIKKFNELKEEINELETNLENLEKQKQKKIFSMQTLEEKENQIKNSEEYLEKQRLKNLKTTKQENLQSLKTSFITFFDTKLLEKYSYYEEDKEKLKFLEDYIKNPVEGLIKDEDLRILEIFEKIKSGIKDQTITTKNPEKTIKNLQTDKSIFLDYQNKIKNLKLEIKNLSEKENTIHLETEDIQKEKEIVKNSLIDIENLILSKNKRKISVLEEKEKLEKDILASE